MQWKRGFQKVFFVSALAVIYAAAICPNVMGYQEVRYSTGNGGKMGYLAEPPGKGPFPAVIYNHGGFADKIGGAPRETCEALAKAGFVGFSPIRRKTRSVFGHPKDVSDALDYLRTIPSVDPQRIAMMGFSRGAALTFLMGLRHPDLKALVIMAPAPAEDILQEALSHASQIDAPVLLLVAQNDHKPADHFGLAVRCEEVLKTSRKNVRLIVYPPHDNDGHRIFFEIGSYWPDVIEFLKKYLR